MCVENNGLLNALKLWIVRSGPTWSSDEREAVAKLKKGGSGLKGTVVKEFHLWMREPTPTNKQDSERITSLDKL